MSLTHKCIQSSAEAEGNAQTKAVPESSPLFKHIQRNGVPGFFFLTVVYLTVLIVALNPFFIRLFYTSGLWGNYTEETEPEWH